MPFTCRNRPGCVKIELDILIGSIERALNVQETRISPWTSAEFERQVFAAQPRVAVFDCDGTLWGGDAGSGFMIWSIEQGLVSRSTSDWLDQRYRAYRTGKVSEEEICGEVVQIYAGLREQELRAAAADYVGQFVRERHFAEMVALVASSLAKTRTNRIRTMYHSAWLV